jgi:hypothetical protein
VTASNTTPGVTDTGATLDTGTFLSATGPSDVSPIPGGIASSLGIDPAGAGADFISPDFGSQAADSAIDSSSGGGAPLGADVSSIGAGASGGGASGLNTLESWLSNPKNLATAGLLGISGFNALHQPKLPSADTTALNAAGPAVQSAEAVINTGGTGTPEWTSQKQSIDATIDQQIQQQTQAIMQAAANSGQGTQNSGIVQQQIAQMTQNANVQRQQLYAQAQQQNVNNAISELTGSNQVLTSIGQTQLAQQQEAQQAAQQTAELALLLQTGGLRIPG